MLSTNHKGAIAETAIIAEATRLGIEVYRPVAEGGRFDMVFAFANGTLARVQCKWANVCNGAVQVRAYSARRAREGLRVRSYTVEEIDALAVYCHENGRCYYLPATMVAGRRVIHLRVAPARNNQAERLHLAPEYELGAIAQLGERSAGSRKVGGSNPPSSIATVRPLG
jgi:PD-(D/E)XK nuclease superfamily protein